MVGLGLQSAIREQRRDRKYITLDYVEAESDNLVYEIDQFSTKSGRLSPSVAESEDFDVINEWIREPDCSEMLSNAETNQSSQEDLLGGICDNSNNSMENEDCRIVAHPAENESRGVIDTEERKPTCEEFAQSSARIEDPPNEVQTVEARFGMVCLGGRPVGNDGEILSQKPPTECPAGQGTVFPIHIQSGTTSSNGVSEISVDNSCTHLEAREESMEYISSARTKEDTKEMPAKSPPFFEGQEAKEPKKEEEMRVPIYEESEAESGEIVSDGDGRDCIDIAESDSDSSSDSSSKDSDDEDEEEGEIRSSNGRIPRADSLDEMLGSSDEEGRKQGPIRTMHELQDLPPVPPVDVVLEDHHQTQPLGTISSVLSGIVLVEGSECHRPLDEGSILWITETRLPLGFIDEVFGPVKNPYYVVRFNSAADVPKYVREGIKVSYVSEFAVCVLNDPSLYKKGYDASGEHDEELSEEVEFSDDEKEAEYNRTRLKTKRGANSRENMKEMDYGKIGNSHGFVDKRKGKNRSRRSHEAGNHAEWLKGEAREIRFASNKPFQNRCRGWNSSAGAKQSKDCGKSQGPAAPCVSPPGQSAGGQLTPINNIEQQSLQHFDPTSSGSLSQAATPVAYPGPATHQLQSPVVSGQSSGQFNANSPGFFHSRPLHDIAGGIPMGHLPGRLLQDPAGGIQLGQPHSRPLHDPAGRIHLEQPQFRPLHDAVGGAFLVQAHSRPLHDPSEGIHNGQPKSRPPLQDTVTGIPLGQPHSKPLHDPAGVIHLGQPSVFGGPMLNGNQIITNPLDLHQRPTHTMYMGSPMHDNSIHPRMPFSGAAWNAGPSNHLAERAQLQASDANQGIISPLHYNKTHTCFAAPLSHHPGSFAPSYGNMGMNTFCNTGPYPGQNVMSCPMPWGQFAPIIQGNLNWQYQNFVPLDGGSVPISQPNNIMPVNAPRSPLPHGPSPQGPNFGQWRPN